jgi:ATP-dependent HslUV protease ATP-binding subunit HslU
MGPAGMEEMTEQLRGMFGQMGRQKRQTRKLRIDEAIKLVQDEEAAKLVNEDEIKTQALQATQSRTASCSSTRSTRSPRARKAAQSAEVSRQGVQRDLLPLVEGTPCHDQIRNDQDRPHPVHRIRRFPSEQAQRPDPELQGPFPIRVELQSLSVQDFESILTQTHASLVKQYQALLATEEVSRWNSARAASRRLAQIAYDVNERTENIGARRLSTVMERLLDEVSYGCAQQPERARPSRWTPSYVDGRLGDLSQNEDLSRYILCKRARLHAR